MKITRRQLRKLLSESAPADKPNEVSKHVNRAIQKAKLGTEYTAVPTTDGKAFLTAISKASSGEGPSIEEFEAAKADEIVQAIMQNMPVTYVYGMYDKADASIRFEKHFAEGG